MNMEYQSTMLSPGKVYLYKPREDLFRFSFGSSIEVREASPMIRCSAIIVGLHSCDTNAVRYLDLTFLGYLSRSLSTKHGGTIRSSSR